MGDIYYSWQENAEKNTANGTLEITSDDYQLFWKLNDFMASDNQLMIVKAAAEILWNLLLEKVGIHDA